VGVIALGLLLLLGASFRSVSGTAVLTMLVCTVAYALYAVLSQRAVIIDSLEPILSALYALVLLGERMKLVALAGGLLIVAGVLIGNLPTTRRNIPSTLPSTNSQ